MKKHLTVHNIIHTILIVIIAGLLVLMAYTQNRLNMNKIYYKNRITELARKQAFLSGLEQGVFMKKLDAKLDSRINDLENEIQRLQEELENRY